MNNELCVILQQASKSNWATAASSNGNHGPALGSATKSLAEIQVEEERQERERQERERKERKSRQKEMGLAQACVWGSATTNLSWANRTATATPPATGNVLLSISLSLKAKICTSSNQYLWHFQCSMALKTSLALKTPKWVNKMPKLATKFLNWQHVAQYLLPIKVGF